MDKFLGYGNLMNQLDKETVSHSRRVADICGFLASHFSLDPDIACRIGLLHDVGKMYVPSRIIKKAGKLTALEREIVDLHAYYSYSLVKGLGEPDIIYMPVLLHHGYWKPKLSDISNERVNVSIMKYMSLVHSADIYDAMTSWRIYHAPFSKDAALNFLRTDVFATDDIVKVLSEYDS